MSVETAGRGSILAKVATVLVAVVFGFAQLLFIFIVSFSGLEELFLGSSAQPLWVLIEFASMFLIFAGAALFGYIFPRLWFLSVINIWFVFSISDSWLLFLVPAATALAAGYIGARLKRLERKIIMKSIFIGGTVGFLFLALLSRR